MGGQHVDRLAGELVSTIRAGDLERISAILNAQPKLIDGTVAGRTWLHHATDWPGNWPNVAQTIALLIKLGADVNARFQHPDNQPGKPVVAETPLHWAASSGNVKSVALLLEAGAVVDSLGGIFGGCTAFEESIIFEHYGAALLLQRAGAAQYLPGAAALGQMARVKGFFTTDGQVRLDVGMLPHWESPPPAQVLLDRGFQFACRAGHLEIASFLRSRGADIWAITPADTSALDEARKNDHQHVVAQLLVWGADRGSAEASGTKARNTPVTNSNPHKNGPPMKLYVNHLSPNSRKVTSVANHLGLECEIKTLDFAKGENRTPEFLAINPNGKLPALQDGDFNLWESNAIMGYLCSKVDTDLWPKSHQRYDITRWMNWELAHWGRWISSYGFETFLKGMFGLGEPDENAMAEAAGFIKRFGKVLDDHLGDQPFLAGENLTIADFAVGSHLTYRIPAKLPLDEFKNILAWETRLMEVPAWRESAPKM